MTKGLRNMYREIETYKQSKINTDREREAMEEKGREKEREREKKRGMI